jgi:hypothetical protein
MNIGFYDPISERWVKPRPERQVEIAGPMSAGEAVLVATEAAALKQRNDKIWEYLKQSAEGCNSIGVAPIVEAPPIVAVPGYEPVAECEVVESLGHVYWKRSNNWIATMQETPSE